MINIEKLRDELKARGQEHLLRYAEELSPAQLKALRAQIKAIDWELIGTGERAQPLRTIEPIAGLSVEEIALRRARFEKIGAAAIRDRKIAAVLLAGGQGTRLGSDAPKGAFNIGVTRELYIFECLIKNLSAVTRAYGEVPLLIMTSEQNDGATKTFLKRHKFFGYPERLVRFFRQETAPCVDFSGKLLLESKGKIACSPNGNGGWYLSLTRAGLLADPLLEHTEWFNVFSVDNVLQRIADPAFVGATVLSGAKAGAKVVKKTDPQERVGVLCLEDGLPRVVEYYELPPEMACAREESGELTYRYGVTLNYLFEAATLKRIAAQRIPVHAAKKKVSYLDEKGNLVAPAEPNAYKFETLILDMVKLAGSCLPFEVEREKEFAPVKNKEGADSVETARELLRKNGVKL